VRVVTSAYSGVFETRPSLRAEFLRLSGAPGR
jgi:GTP cyclohydrolase I